MGRPARPYRHRRHDGQVVSTLLRSGLEVAEGAEFREHLAERGALIASSPSAGPRAVAAQPLRAPRPIVDSALTLLVYVIAFWYALNVVNIVEYALKSSRPRPTPGCTRLVPLIQDPADLRRDRGCPDHPEQRLRSDVDVAGGTWDRRPGDSLAAQDSLRNLFGSITILLDRPFRPEDLISFSGFLGGVEEIGFRSVKVRTLDGHLVTVPNSKVVNEAIEDIGARPNMRRVMTITITYDTPPEKVRGLGDREGLFEEDGFRNPVMWTWGRTSMPHTSQRLQGGP